MVKNLVLAVFQADAPRLLAAKMEASLHDEGEKTINLS
jgi:hypothetical protein